MIALLTALTFLCGARVAQLRNLTRARLDGACVIGDQL